MNTIVENQVQDNEFALDNDVVRDLANIELLLVGGGDATYTGL
jgi:hypothetical protein